MRTHLHLKGMSILTAMLFFVNPIFAQTNYASRGLSITASAQRGPSGFSTASQEFESVLPPTAPTITAIDNQMMCPNSSTSPIPFTVGDVETAAGSLLLSAVSNNQSLIADAQIVFGGSGANRTVTVANTNIVGGTAIITVTVTDGDLMTATSNFSVTVNPLPDVNAITNKVICAGSATGNISFTGNVAGTVFDWTNTTTSIGLAASGTGSISSFNGVNSGTAPVTATISVTPSRTNIITATFIECNTVTGDDRGGIVATQNYIYLTGDNSTARFNHDLTGGVSLGVSRDAIFCDISGAGTVYSFSNSGTPFTWASGTSNQIIALDANFAPTGSPINLSTTLTLLNGSSVFSGKGYVIFYDAATDHFYRISLPGGVVTDMGVSPVAGFSSTPYPTESWGRWGYSELSGGVYSVIFRNSLNHNLESLNLSTGVITVLKSFTNLSDMANIVLSPWDNRVYVHWEGGTQWGGSDESIGYLPYPFTSAATTCTGTPVDFTITVNPTATVNAISNQRVCNGASTTAVTFSSPTTGGTIVYNWTNNTTSIGLAASGSGDIAAFTATNSGTAPVTATITVTPAFTNGGVTCNCTPITFTITVNPTAVMNAPLYQSVCDATATTAVNFGSANTGGTMSYSWTNSATSIGLAASGTGNIAAFTASNTGTAPVTATITVTPSYTSGGVTCTGSAISFDITVSPAGQVNQPANQVVCNNGTVAATSFSTVNTGATTTYAWTNNNTSIGLAASGTGDIASFTGINTGTSPVTATITVTPSFGNAPPPLRMNNEQNNPLSYSPSCPGTAKTFTITINPSATMNGSADRVVCIGTSVSQTLTSSNTGGTVTYAWVNDNTEIGLAASGTGDIAAFSATNTHTYPVSGYITITPTFTNAGVGCSSATWSFLVTVNPDGQVNQPADQVVCNNASTAAVGFTTQNTGGTTTYAWTNDNTSIGLPASGSGDISSFTAVNTGTTPVTATIVVTPTFMAGAPPARAALRSGTILTGSGNCTGTPKTFTITVNPSANVNVISDTVVCAGSSMSQVFTTNNTGGTTTYAWTNNNTAIGLPASGTGDISTFQATNTGSTAISAVITVTPTYTNGVTACVGSSRLFTITVNPKPIMDVVTNKIICASSATGNIDFTSNLSGTVFDWTNDNNTIGLASSGTGSILSFNAINTGNTPVVANISVTPSLSSVIAATFIECNTWTGDDRGGIVATQNYVYLTGDAATARFNHDLTGAVSTGVMRDAIFCDNSGAGTVYSFANGGTPMNGGFGTATQIIALDANLAPSGSAINLSTSLSLSYGSGLFSGNGYMIFYSAATDHFYRISLPGGVVTDMGVSPVAGFSSIPYTTECWGRWGYSELTGGIYSVIFRNSNNYNLESLNLNTGVISVLKSFTNLSDMANIVLSPWDNRVYVHWEGVTQWGGSDESVGYLPYSFGSTATTCVGDPVNFTITINPTATVNTIANSVVCNNAPVAAINFSSPATGGTIVYNWTNNQTSIGLAASGTGNIAAFTAANTGTAPVTATITVTPVFTNAGVSCTGTAMSFTITVNPAGQVNQPVSQVVCNQSNTAAYNFTTANTGGVTLYSWNNSNTTIGLSAFGSGNIPSFTAVNNGTAPVTANLNVNGTFNNGNTACGGSFKNFTITVNPTAQVNQPADMILCNNEASTVSFGTVNTGGTTTYAWTNSNNSIGIPASGTGDIASFTAVNTGTAPVTATIVVTPTFTNGGMSCSGPSKTFTITVNPTAQVNQTGSETVCAGGTWWTTFSTVNTGGTTTYSWVNNNIAIGLPSSGTGIVPPFTTTNNGINPLVATITVTPTFTNAGISCTGPSKSFTLTVMPYPTVNQPENQVVCNGANTVGIVFDNGSVATPFYYTWTNTANSIGLASSGTGDIASFTAINTGNSPVTATIVVTPWYTNGAIICSGDPKTFTIVVNPTAQVNNIANQVICNGSATTAVTLGTIYTGGTTTYAWTNDQTSIGLAASGTGNIASFVGVNNGTTPVTATITVTPSFTNAGVTCSGPVKTFTITVNPTAQVNQPVSQVICFSSTASATVFGTVNSGGTTTYAWTNDNTSIGLAASGSGDIAGFNVINTGTTPQIATITVTPTFANGGTNCTGPVKTFTITVYPEAQISQPANQVVCNGSGTSVVTFGTPVTGITVVYNWVNDNPSIGLAASGSGNLASFTAVNSGLSPVTANITITPVIINGASSCEGPAKTFTITVNPTASVNQPANLVHCTDIGTSPVIFSTDRTGGVTTYAWTNSNPSIGLPASGTGNIPSFIGVNTGLVPVVGTITVTPTFTNGGVSCSGPVKTFTITINPMPTIVCPANITVNNDPGVCGAVVNYAAVVTGTPTPVVTYSIPSGYLFPIGTTTVTVTATNICNTVTCSFTVTVVDNEAPVLTVPANITVTATGACTSVVNYSVTATDNCPGVVLTRTAGPASGSAFPIGVTTVTYSATDAYNHTVIRSFTVTVLDGQIPVITSQPVNTTVCETATASFRVTATNAVSYQWQTWNGSAWTNMTGIITAVNTLANTTVAMNTNSYRVQVNGLCMNVVSGYGTLYVNSLPQVSIASTAGLVTAPGGTFTIQATANHTGGTYAWYRNNVLISTGTESALTNLGVDDAGTYKVVYTDLAGCTATSANLEVQTETLTNIYLYPNPSTGLFKVKIFTQQPDNATIRIFDRKGALVYLRAHAISAPSTTLEINLPALGIRSAGVYTVEIRYQNNPKVERRQVIVAN